MWIHLQLSSCSICFAVVPDLLKFYRSHILVRFYSLRCPLKWRKD